MRVCRLRTIILSLALLLLCAHPGRAEKKGFLIVHVDPKQAYIYADGEPVVETKGHYIILSPGEHRIDLYNYGYRPETRNVMIVARKTWVMHIKMEAVPGSVLGPWGCITLEGAPHAAVLLNGKDPAIFFVGYGDEFDNERIWKQELVVPPGKHELTVAYLDFDPWTTTVEVKANQRVVVDAYNGVRKTLDWPRGDRLKEVPRFQAGIASTRVAVEKIEALFSSSTGEVRCGDSAHLKWAATGAAYAEINGAPVSASGEQTVQPKQTTTYHFLAAGPSGAYTADATVNVNSSVSASLSVSPQEVRYNPAGEKIEPGPPTVTWSAGNADSVSIDPLGSVGASGSQQVQVPSPSSSAPDDQPVTYTLHASNACGGSDTRTATLHVKGLRVLQSSANTATIEVDVNFDSLYFPTDMPRPSDTRGAVVPSQEKRMADLVSNFKEYLELHPNTNLILEGHADARGPVAYNQALSQRRAELVKGYLVEHGFPAERIETVAFGKLKNLTDKQIIDLAAQDPQATAEDRRLLQRNIVIFRWANNRRVDIRVNSTGQTSRRFFPYNSGDLKVLLREEKSIAQSTLPPK